MGFIFWGVFVIYGLFLLGYFIWMMQIEKNNDMAGKGE